MPFGVCQPLGSVGMAPDTVVYLALVSVGVFIFAILLAGFGGS